MQIEQLREQRDFHFSFHSIFIEPYQEAKKNFRIVFPTNSQQQDCIGSLPLTKKIIHLLKCLVYCLPVINSIIYIASQILKAKRKDNDWEHYYQQQPQNALAEENLKVLLEEIPHAIKNACICWTNEKDKVVKRFLAALHFDDFGKLKNIEYDYEYIYDNLFLKNKEYFSVALRIKLAKNRCDNHNPFYFDPEIFSEHQRDPKKIKEIAQLMVDKLNQRHSALALASLKKSDYDLLLDE